VTDTAGGNIGTHVFNVTIVEREEFEDTAGSFIQDELAQTKDPAPAFVEVPEIEETALDGELRATVDQEQSLVAAPTATLEIGDSRTFLIHTDTAVPWDVPWSYVEPQRANRYDLESGSEIPETESIEKTADETVAITVAEMTSEEKADRITNALREALDLLTSDLDEAASSQFANAQAMMAAGHIGGATLSVGMLAWLFRAGSLLASVLSVMPLWTRMDPLPVLLAKKRREDDEAETDDEEEAAARILDGGRADRQSERGE
jgi:hypothetical protein